MQRDWPFPAYPNGWFVVAYGDELACGDVRPIDYFGEPLVMWRDESGAAHVLDAHCRHLGAHLGYGGSVDGTSIRCPFHAWRWRPDGVCDDIPYAKKIPKGAKIRSWPVCEQNGFLFVWHHAEARDPDYEIPVLPEYGSDEWTDYTRLAWTVRSRMYDMGENAVDHIHFKTLHGASGAPTNEQKRNQDGTFSNLSQMEMTTPRGPVKGAIESSGVGPGFGVVHVHGIAETIILTTNTPIDDERVQVRFSYMQRRTDDPHEQRVAAAMLRDIKHQMEQDIVVFENKRYWTRPLLVKEDGPIGEYRKRARRWYSGEFYRLPDE